MEEVTAAIRDGDTVLADDVTVWIDSVQSPGGFAGWTGRFSLPGFVILDGEGPFRLDAADGRSAEILVTHVSPGQTTDVRFTVTGPFA